MFILPFARYLCGGLSSDAAFPKCLRGGLSSDAAFPQYLRGALSSDAAFPHYLRGGLSSDPAFPQYVVSPRQLTDYVTSCAFLGVETVSFHERQWCLVIHSWNSMTYWFAVVVVLLFFLL